MTQDRKPLCRFLTRNVSYAPELTDLARRIAEAKTESERLLGEEEFNWDAEMVLFVALRLGLDDMAARCGVSIRTHEPDVAEVL
jgi:hypothetical protein